MLSCWILLDTLSLSEWLGASFPSSSCSSYSRGLLLDSEGMALNKSCISNLQLSKFESLAYGSYIFDILELLARLAPENSRLTPNAAAYASFFEHAGLDPELELLWGSLMLSLLRQSYGENLVSLLFLLSLTSLYGLELGR